MIMFTGPLPPQKKNSDLLLHYDHLPEKNFRCMLRDSWTLALLEFIHLFHDFSWNT